MTTTHYLTRHLPKNILVSGLLQPLVERGRGIGENTNIVLPEPSLVAECAVLTTEVEKLRGENRKLRQLAQASEERLTEIVKIEIQEVLGRTDPGVEEKVEVIELRDISNEVASVEILELFKSSDTVLFYSDISNELSLDIEQVVEVCSQLREKGEIRIGDRD